MLIEGTSLWAAQTNAYIVAAEPGGPAVLVDAPPDPEGVLGLLARHDLHPVAALITHGHVDHVGGAGEVSRRSGAVAYLHPDDEWLATDPESQLRGLFGLVPPGDFGSPSFLELADGQELSLAGLTIGVIHTPGHTPGHCCFHLESEGVLFSGDQLFAGSIGRTDLPGGNLQELMRSMEEKVMVLPDDTQVLPGHGPATTLAQELRSNPFLQSIRS